MNKEGRKALLAAANGIAEAFPATKEGVAVALKDMMKDMANAAVSQAQSAVQDAIDRDQQTINGQGTSGVVQGVMGHYSELSAESAQQQYGMYLMRGESFTRCFALVRDKMLFTDRQNRIHRPPGHDWCQGGGRVHRPPKHRRGGALRRPGMGLRPRRAVVRVYHKPVLQGPRRADGDQDA